MWHLIEDSVKSWHAQGSWGKLEHTRGVTPPLPSHTIPTDVTWPTVVAFVIKLRDTW